MDQRVLGNMETLFNSFEDDWDFWSEIQESLDSIDGSVTVSGTLGLWDGTHEIVPEEFDSISVALDKCLGHDTEDVVLKYCSADNYYVLDCTHHDGTNKFIIKINE